MKVLVLLSFLVSSLAMAAEDKKICSATCIGVSNSMEVTGVKSLKLEGRSENDSFNKVAAACWIASLPGKKYLVVSYSIGPKIIAGTEVNGNYLQANFKEANVENCQE